MKFYTQFDRPEKAPRMCSKESMTEQAHVRVRDQIKEFQRSGRILRAARVGQYEFGPRDEDPAEIVPNPVSDADLDISEVVAAADAAQARLEAQAAVSDVAAVESEAVVPEVPEAPKE